MQSFYLPKCVSVTLALHPVHSFRSLSSVAIDVTLLIPIQRYEQSLIEKDKEEDIEIGKFVDAKKVSQDFLELTILKIWKIQNQ